MLSVCDYRMKDSQKAVFYALEHNNLAIENEYVSALIMVGSLFCCRHVVQDQVGEWEVQQPWWMKS